jgi:tetratricopeptide (TPR) repeat protein
MLFRCCQWIAVSLLVLAPPLATVAQQQPQWMSAFQEALSELKSNRLASASTRFDELWRQYPGDSQLLTSVGAALDSTAHHPEATAWYQRALAASPDYEPALNDLGLNYVSQGKFAEAAPVLEHAIRVNPRNLQGLYNLGLLQLKLKRYRDAALTLKRADTAAVGSAAQEQIRLAEATALFNVRNYKEAERVLTAPMEARSAGRLLLLGSAQALDGDLPSAIGTLQEATRQFPANAAVYYRLALVLTLGRRNHDAQEVLSSGLKIIPDSALLWYGQAVIDDSIGLYEEAARCARESLKQRAEQPDAWGLLGGVYLRLGRLDDAQAAYEKALSYGADTQVRVNYAECLIRLGRFRQAGEQLTQLEHAEPNSAEVNRGLGKLYRAKGDFAKAEPALRRAVELDPADSEAHFALAETLRHLGRLEAAKKEYAEFERTKNASRMVRLLEVS